MRAFFRDLSVSRKLVAIQLITAGVFALLLTSAVSIGQRSAIESSRLTELKSIADLIGYNSLAPLDFQDPDAGMQVLKSLSAEPSMVVAAVYDAGRKVAFTYQHDPAAPMTIPTVIAIGEKVDDDYLTVVRAIQRKGSKEPVGFVYLKASMADVQATIRDLLLVMGVILVLALLVAFLTSRLLARAVLRPVDHLIDTMGRVGVTANYSLRVPAESADEFGQLGADFNRMLEIVEARDSELEARVEARTNALAASESRLDNVVDSTLEGIVVFDSDGLIVLTNPVAAATFGHSRAALLGRQISEFLEPSTQVSVDDLTGMLQSRLNETILLRARRTDGFVLDVEVRTNDYQLDGEDYYVAAVSDISERERLERLKNEFVATVSHELRTPLTNVLGSLKLVLGGVTGEVSDETTALLKMAERNGDRLITLVNELLDIQRIEAGRLALDLGETNLVKVVDDVVAEMAGMATEFDVSVVGPKYRGPVVVVRGDAARLHQVFTNLISNAIKHSFAGGTVQLTLERDRTLVRVHVIDQGEGIAPDDHDRIFDKFQQVDASDSRAKGGTGLGLAIVRALVRAHNGKVDVVSALGEGATFRVSLPLVGNRRVRTERHAGEFLERP